MLESFINFKEINERPWLVFVWAFIVSSVAILVSMWLSFHVLISGINVDLTGLFAVIFTIIPSVFFVTLLIKREEALEEEYIKKHYHDDRFWERHSRDLMIFLLFFAGITLAFAFWYVILPATWSMLFGAEILSENVFMVQVSKISQIRGLAGSATELHPQFLPIFANNMQVMFFSFLFSFIFGAGAVFIIAWNASILGIAIGQISESLWYIPTVSMGFVLHGVPEIAGYLAAALAGGLLSAAIIRGHGSEVLKKVLRDAVLILLFAFFSIICGAVIEASGGMIFLGSLVLWWGAFIYMIMRFFFKLQQTASYNKQQTANNDKKQVE